MVKGRYYPIEVGGASAYGGLEARNHLPCASAKRSQIGPCVKYKSIMIKIVVISMNRRVSGSFSY